MIRTVRTFAALVFATGLAACGTSSTAGGGGGTTPATTTTAPATSAADPAQAGAVALGAQLGISETVVTAGLGAARAALGTSEAPKTDAEKAAAAQAGVDKAAVQAEAEGKPLAEEQKTGLLEGLKSLL
jgi:hypothetical protein